MTVRRLEARILDRLWAPVPAERLAAVRLLVGLFSVVYLTIQLPALFGYVAFPDRQFRPIGVLWLLESPPPPAVVIAGVIATWVTGLGFLAGWRFRLTGPLHAVLLLAALTYRNSWGQIFHTENLLVLYVLVLAAVRSADAYSLDARRRGAVPPADGRYGWPLLLLCVFAVSTYFIAGLAKLRWGGAGWAGGEVLRDTIAADSLRKVVLGSMYSPLVEYILDQTWLLRGLALLTLVVELGAPFALLGRRIAFVWTIAVLGFHLGVALLMTILFAFPMSGVAFAPFFRPERLVERARARFARKRRASAEPDRAESSRAEPDRAEPDQLEPGRPLGRRTSD